MCIRMLGNATKNKCLFDHGAMNKCYIQDVSELCAWVVPLKVAVRVLGGEHSDFTTAHGQELCKLCD